MFLCLFVCLFFIWIISLYPHEDFLKGLERLDLILLCYCIFKNLFICFCVCLFVYILLFSFELSEDSPRKISWKFCKNRTWFRWDIVDLKNVYLFVCWFIFCFFLHLNHLEIPPEWFPESFVWIRLDFAEILLI